MEDFEKQKADALDAVRRSKCVGAYLHVPVGHMATITKALQPVPEAILNEEGLTAHDSLDVQVKIPVRNLSKLRLFGLTMAELRMAARAFIRPSVQNPATLAAPVDESLYKVKSLIEAYCLGSDKDGLSKAIGQIDLIRAATKPAAQSVPQVVVEALERDIDYLHDQYRNQKSPSFDLVERMRTLLALLTDKGGK